MKPVAFRVYDFKSIRDSGWCDLSGDGITIVAGQNESGKSSILTALRDFDLPDGKPPQTPDYYPDDRFDAEPRVAVRFAVDVSDIRLWLEEEEFQIPEVAMAKISRDGILCVTRNLDSGRFSLDKDIASLWPEVSNEEEEEEEEDEVESSEEESSKSELVPVVEDIPAKSKLELLSPSRFATILREHWPNFVYFDTFSDTLPRNVLLSDLRPPKKVSQTGTSPAVSMKPKAPQSVVDFITLAGIDLDFVDEHSREDKSLSNYLSTRSASITGDFLSYWKQRVDGEQVVNLQVRGQTSCRVCSALDGLETRPRGL